MTRYWIGVAARTHVLRAVDGGFCQLGHGREALVRRLAPGDGLAVYAPRETLEGKQPVQAFVAIGRVAEGEVYRAEQASGFRPFRRRVAWCPAHEAPVRPLLERLSFVRDARNWGMAFRRSLFEVPEADFLLIAEAMGVRETFAAGA